MRRTAALLLATSMLVAAPVARAGWVVNATGECQQAWIAPPAAQGPVAMLNALPLPFRQAVGGGQVAAATDTKGKGAVATGLSWPALIFGGFGVGLIELPIWFITGLGDTLTLGAFDMVPNDAKALTLTTVRPRFLDAASATPASCGQAGKPAP